VAVRGVLRACSDRQPERPVEGPQQARLGLPPGFGPGQGQLRRDDNRYLRVAQELLKLFGADFVVIFDFDLVEHHLVVVRHCILVRICKIVNAGLN
jgi:hypothetical protein